MRTEVPTMIFIEMRLFLVGHLEVTARKAKKTEKASMEAKVVNAEGSGFWSGPTVFSIFFHTFLIICNICSIIPLRESRILKTNFLRLWSFTVAMVADYRCKPVRRRGCVGNVPCKTFEIKFRIVTPQHYPTLCNIFQHWDWLSTSAALRRAITKS